MATVSSASASEHALFGVPTLAFMAVTWFALHQVNFRFWRLRLWTWRNAEKFFVDGVENLGSMSSVVLAGWSFCASSGPILLLTWGITLAADSQLLSGLAVVLLGTCLFVFAYAVCHWATNMWRMGRSTAILFGFGSACYLGLIFALSFLAPGSTLFDRSVHFLALNFLCIVELMSTAEDKGNMNLTAFLESQVPTQRVGPSMQSGLSLDGRPGTSLSPKAFGPRPELVLGERPVTAVGGRPTTAVGPRPELALGERPTTVFGVGDASLDRPISMPNMLQEQIQLALKTANVTKSRKQKLLYFLSLLVLLAYSLVMALTNDADQDSRLGWIISVIIVGLDALLWIYSQSGRLTTGTMKLVVSGGSRIALISFGVDGWFLGLCVLYLLAGGFLAHAIVDTRIPLDADNGRTRDSVRAKQQPMRMRQFLARMHPEDPAYVEEQHLFQPGELLADVRRHAKLSWPELTLICMTVGFAVAMALTLALQLGAVRFGGTDETVVAQIWLGVAALVAVLLIAMGVATMWSYRKNAWQLDTRTLVLIAVTQAVYTGLALGLYFGVVDSVALLVLLSVVPAFCIVCLATFKKCGRVDWELCQPRERRNPPMESCWRAFWTGGLTIDDYQLWAGVSLLIGLIALLGALLSLLGKPQILGWSLAFVLFILITSLLPVVKFVQTLSLDFADKLLIPVSLVAHFTFFGLLSAALDDISAELRLLLWAVAILYPCALWLTTAIYHYRRTRRIDLFLGTALLAAILAFIGLLIACYSVLTWVQGGLITALIVLGALVAALMVTWVRRQYVLAYRLRVAAALLCLLLMAFGGLVGLAFSEEGTSTGFWCYSGSWFVLVVFLWAGSKGAMYQVAGGKASWHLTQYVFPVHYFDPRRSDVAVHNPPYLVLAGAGLMLFLWSIAAILVNHPTVGLAASALFIVCGFTYIRQLTLGTTRALSDIAPFLTEPMVNRARYDAHTKQVAGTFTELSEEQRARILAGEIKAVRAEARLAMLQLRVRLSLAATLPCLTCSDYLSVAERSELVRQLQECESQLASLSSLDFRVKAHFYFLLLAVTRSTIQQEEALFREFALWLGKQSNGQEAVDPYITDDEIYGSPVIDGWSFSKFQLMEQRRAEFFDYRRGEQRKNEALRRKEDEARRRRDDRRNVVVNVAVTSTGMQITHSDTDVVYQQILRTCSAQQPFEDRAWPASDDSLYYDGARDASQGNIHTMAVSEWLRPPQILANDDETKGQAPVVFEDGAALSDLQQGAIGDCYFITALGLLALRKPKLLLELVELPDRNQGYIDAGAFMVRFYRSGELTKVIIDDRLPVGGNGLPVFGRCVSLREQWVALIEKAYAKLYGTYEAIEAGKVHQALMDLTDGFGEEVPIKDDSGMVENVDLLWNKVKEHFDAEYLLGVGSNSGADTNYSQGIAFGHAYAITNMYEGNGERLLELQNPWGLGSQEWVGDWSDHSDKWTKWWLATLNPQCAGDGKFWMSFLDFVSHFQNVFVCRVLKKQAIRSGWMAGSSAAGPYQPANNPHFLLKVPRRMRVLIQLEQDSVRDQKGKELAYMNFFVLRAEPSGQPGSKLTHQRVSAITRDNVVGMGGGGGMPNDQTVSAEIYLDDPEQAYAVVCIPADTDCTTGFTVSIFCNPEPGLEFTGYADNVPYVAPERKAHERNASSSQAHRTQDSTEHKADILQLPGMSDDHESDSIAQTDSTVPGPVVVTEWIPPAQEDDEFEI